MLFKNIKQNILNKCYTKILTKSKLRVKLIMFIALKVNNNIYVSFIYFTTIKFF